MILRDLNSYKTSRETYQKYTQARISLFPRFVSTVHTKKICLVLRKNAKQDINKLSQIRFKETCDITVLKHFQPSTFIFNSSINYSHEELNFEL